MATSLAELDVLALDCQATAPSPARGHLLEIGWSDVRAGNASSPVETKLLRLPEGVEVPRRVRRVTGIDESTLADGVPPETVWPAVVETARAIAARNRDTQCTTVIHFSRFEEPYLRWLEEKAGTSFPLSIVCTHEIARRLLPALPRRGLRAVAGYFGHSVAELRRASQHVAATTAVWRAAVSLLDQKEGVRTPEDLDAWLRAPRTKRHIARAYPMHPDRRRHLPDRPGVYRMLRAGGDVLYVGKATSLRQRVRSYFHEGAKHGEHILEMLSQARELELTVTGTALEAALEETDTIKKLSPPYNKALRAGERSIAFATRTFESVSPTYDREHRLGPLAGGELLRALAILAGGRDDASPAETLATSEAYAPKASTFADGVELFRDRLGAASLVTRGSTLWRERCDAVNDDEADAFRLELQYDVGVDRWTPERVASALEEIVLRGAHQVRRGHWLCLLSESTLVWSEPDAGEVALEIVRGGVHARGDRYRPRAYASFDARQSAFDLDTFDRMIVLTKEVRRLVTDKRDVRLHVAPSVVLDADKLAAHLKWI